MNEFDIWRTAKVLIDAHRENAAIEAKIRVEYAASAGLPEVAEVWLRVLGAIGLLRRRTF